MKRKEELIVSVAVADHLIWGPQRDDLDVSILVGDSVPVPQPVKIMHHATTARHMALYG